VRASDSCGGWDFASDGEGREEGNGFGPVTNLGLIQCRKQLGLRWAIKWAFIKLCLFYVVVKERTDIHLPFKLKVGDQNRRWFLSNFAVVRR
jgi:hypothetical protein